MGKKKQYTAARTMCLVCVDCKCLWKKCACLETAAWILVTSKELNVFCKTGLVPDRHAELYWSEGQPKPKPIPLVHPPEYGFKVE